MAATKVRRALKFTVILLFVVQVKCESMIKDLNVRIHPYRPKGFKLSFEDAPGLKPGIWISMYLNGSTYHIDNKDYLQQDTDASWFIDNTDVQLKINDNIVYYFLLGDSPVYTSNTTVEDDCRPSVTKVRGGKASAGHTILEDNFNSLREDVWQTEQYIPVNHPENPFISYQHLTNEEATVTVLNGTLRITPRLQQNLPGFNNQSIDSGTLNLFSSCTSATEACVKEASGADILPPVASGRIISKGFVFTYGTVHVRAKLPQGDWLYPEILLEPFLKKYGRLNYASGVLKIATAHGNRELRDGSNEYSNKVLYGGPIMDIQCRDILLKTKLLTDGRQWGDDYHVYSVRWAPDRIIFSVDEEEWARVDPTASGLAGRIPKHCDQLPRTLLALSSKLAPFNDHFYITLGVAAGSVTEFRDGATTEGGRPKPWSNQGRKAMFYFCQDTDAWLKTWTQPELLIDYVKVVAL